MTRSRFFVAALALGLLGCKHIEHSRQQAVAAAESVLTLQPEQPLTCDNKSYNDEDLNRAALDVLFPKLTYFTHDDQVTKQQLDRAYDRLARVEAFTKTIENSRIKDAYLKWLKFYRDQYDERALELQDKTLGLKPPSETSREQEEKRRRLESQRAEDLAKCLPRPK